MRSQQRTRSSQRYRHTTRRKTRHCHCHCAVTNDVLLQGWLSHSALPYLSDRTVSLNVDSAGPLLTAQPSNPHHQRLVQCLLLPVTQLLVLLLLLPSRQRRTVPTMSSRSLPMICVLAVLLCALSVCHAQPTVNCSSVSGSQYTALQTGTSLFPVTTIGCNSSSIPTYLQWTFVLPPSTGNLTWTLIDTNTQTNLLSHALNPITVATNASDCGYSTIFVNAELGAMYGLRLSCATNQTGLPGQCSAFYNLSLTCAQVTGTPVVPLSSSSTGPNAAAPTALAGVGTWGWLALLSVVCAMAGWTM